MKKITLLIAFLTISVGFAQTNLEDFEGTPDFAGFEGLGGANVVANPSVDSNNGSATVGQLIVDQSGQPWQGANLVMQENYLDVSDPVNNTVTIQVYSTTAFTLFAKLADGQNGAVDSAADAEHSGSGWETLTYTFNENLDNTASANGEYGILALFPNWNGNGWHDPEIEITVYVDNITGTEGSSIGGDNPPVSGTNLEDFEGTPDFTGFEGLGGANVVANPSVDANNGSATVGQLIVVQSGQPWQGANLVMQENYVDISDPVNNPVSVDVYSTSAFTLFAKTASGQSGAVDSAADAEHSGSGWETLTFTFNENLDNTSSANGEYEILAFFPNWNGSGWNDPEIERTVYIDNVTGTAGSSIGSGPSDPTPASAATVPTTADENVYSIYNDTNAYTTTFPIIYSFGGATDVDLEDGDGVNNALKVNLNSAGFGQGEGGPDDVSEYDYVNFNYWYSGTPGFRFVMIDNDGSVGEFEYEIGSVANGDEADLVSETWTQVSIPMSYFTGIGFDSSNFFQWKVDRYGLDTNNGGYLYLDNIVLTKNNPLSIEDSYTFKSIIYPNPASDNLTISTPNNVIKSVEVFNLLGKRIMSQMFNDSQVIISVQSLSSGVYLARLTTESGIKTIKLIRE